MAKKLSEEWKEKIRVALKGRKRPAEVWNGQTLCKPCHDHLHNELGRGIKYKI